MDQNRFDVLTRSLSGVLPRRAVVRGLVGAGCGLSALRLSDAVAAKRKKKKRKKRKPALRCDVCRSGCAFTSVQAAIDAANPEDTIRLCPETYLEHLFVEKNLTLLGAGADRTALDGGGTSNANAVLYIGVGAIVEVRALTVRGGNSTVGGGIDNEGTLTLADVTVTANTASEGAGIFNLAGAALRLIDSRVSGNTADDDGGGLWVDGGTVTLTRSRVTGNEAVEPRWPRWRVPHLRRHGDAQRESGDGEQGDRGREPRGWVLHLPRRPGAHRHPGDG